MDEDAPLVMVNGTLAKKFVPVANDAEFDIQVVKAGFICTVKSLVCSVLPVAELNTNRHVESSPVRE